MYLLRKVLNLSIYLLYLSIPTLSPSLKNLYKIQINWSKIGTGSEQSELTVASLL